MQSIMLCSYEVISFMCGDHMMPFLTHFIGITSSIRAQYGIDLPGSLHTNKIPVILGRYPLPRFFCRLSIVPLDMDRNGFVLPLLVTFHGGILPCGFSQKRNSRI